MRMNVYLFLSCTRVYVFLFQRPIWNFFCYHYFKSDFLSDRFLFKNALQKICLFWESRCYGCVSIRWLLSNFLCLWLDATLNIVIQLRLAWYLNVCLDVFWTLILNRLLFLFWSIKIAAAQGAIDEDVFINSFEVVPKIQVRPVILFIFKGF